MSMERRSQVPQTTTLADLFSSPFNTTIAPKALGFVDSINRIYSETDTSINRLLGFGPGGFGRGGPGGGGGGGPRGGGGQPPQ